MNPKSLSERHSRHASGEFRKCQVVIRSIPYNKSAAFSNIMSISKDSLTPSKHHLSNISAEYLKSEDLSLREKIDLAPKVFTQKQSKTQTRTASKITTPISPMIDKYHELELISPIQSHYVTLPAVHSKKSTQSTNLFRNPIRLFFDQPNGGLTGYGNQLGISNPPTTQRKYDIQPTARRTIVKMDNDKSAYSFFEETMGTPIYGGEKSPYEVLSSKKVPVEKEQKEGPTMTGNAKFYKGIVDKLKLEAGIIKTTRQQIKGDLEDLKQRHSDDIEDIINEFRSRVKRIETGFGDIQVTSKQESFALQKAIVLTRKGEQYQNKEHKDIVNRVEKLELSLFGKVRTNTELEE